MPGALHRFSHLILITLLQLTDIAPILQRHQAICLKPLSKSGNGSDRAQVSLNLSTNQSWGLVCSNWASTPFPRSCLSMNCTYVPALYPALVTCGALSGFRVLLSSDEAISDPSLVTWAQPPVDILEIHSLSGFPNGRNEWVAWGIRSREQSSL